MLKFIIILIALLLLVYYINIPKRIHGGGGVSIDWTDRFIYNTKQIIELIEPIEQNINRFEPMNPDEYQLLKKHAVKMKVPTGQLMSIRDILATQKAINARKQINKYVHNIKPFYEKNNDPAKFFKLFPAPPLFIFNMLDKNDSEKYETFKIYATKHDSESPDHYRSIQKTADHFELELIKWIKQTYPNVKFRTQTELVEQQTLQYGRPIITPDILFDEPVLFRVKRKPTNSIGRTNFTSEISDKQILPPEEDRLIRWIDAKNFTLIKAPFIVHHIEKQAEKYNQHFGPGALVFHYGYTDNIIIPNTLILDASFILS